MTHIHSRNPRTGELQFEPLAESAAEDVDVTIQRAHAAWREWSDTSPEDRARVLDAIAEALDHNVEELADIADSETALGRARLVGEVGRTTFQLRLFASELRDGTLLATELDEAVEGAPPAGHPRLERRWVSLGPVAVFGASNFPFAFGELGGDTASALAAGCTVVVKEHPSHPVLAARVIELAQGAAVAAGQSADLISGVRGFEAGKQLVVDPHISAVGFTGSHSAGRALFDLAGARPVPIPFYGELGSMNPVFITQAALDARLEDLAAEAAGSISLGLGQFCTKPALIFVPKSPPFVDLVALALEEMEPGPLLGELSHQRFIDSVDSVTAVPGVEQRVPLRGSVHDRIVGPGLLVVGFRDFVQHENALLEECFGPIALVVMCDGEDDFMSAASMLPGSLVATLHAEADGDRDLVTQLVPLLAQKSGRVVMNGWPTGVAVSHSQHHGGPYPASTAALHTSVGSHAMMRFVRPVVFQNFDSGLWPSISV